MSGTTSKLQPSPGPWLPVLGEGRGLASARLQGIRHARHPLQEKVQENRRFSLARPAKACHCLEALKPMTARVLTVKSQLPQAIRRPPFQGLWEH
jgi:hypothetical protein